ncbi:serine/threonine-protein kinase [Actinomadura opuntiae]|uniref:serine/threonine-protein kinase n=1 Tax=Actinomadura sp. OS1-43 TaxID=604315 RepID=UPI00255AA9E3|nr:serine/threonine-protein kinase [Actinomadura sp. OS1-43]MDL4815176.1 serine/threonine-protein kinase [Actinomadura sp. OS1-43]
MRWGARIAGRYRLVHGPARGGSSEVWLAEDTELHRQVVLKRALTGGRGAAFGRVRAEARALAAFNHPNVVTLYDVVPVRRRGRVTPWLVMEYVPGGSLAKWRPVEPAVAARIGAQIAAALEALHAAGIVHCDVKPGNIVVTEDRTAKLADFGAAFRAEGAATRPSGVAHTPAYAAPEVALGRPEPASDVYSLGATLHALISGAPTRPGAALAAEAEPLHDVLASMLQDDPAARPAPAEVRQRLDEAAGTARVELPDYAAPTLGAPDTAPDDPRPDHSLVRGTLNFVSAHRGLSALGALALAAAVVLALMLAPSTGKGRPAASSTTPASRIGDQRGADPCALTAPGALGRFGEPRIDAHYGNFNRCDVLVSRGGHDDYVDVEVQLDNASAPEATGLVTYDRGIGVVREPAEHDSCERTLLLPAPDQDTSVYITAGQDGGTAPLCAIADTAAASAVGVLHRGPIARRSPPPAATSLAQRDTCLLLDARALDAVPGIDADDPDVGFGRWRCEWHSTTQDVQVKLRFDQGGPLDARDGRPTRLNGHPAFVQPDGDGGEERSCLVLIVHRTYPGPHGDEIAEVVHLVVQGEPSMRRLCSMATGLAGTAAAALPRAA